MLLNCIIDGNFILSKLVFTLHKNNLLYGNLYQSLENSVLNYRKWYPFTNVYFVSDSKEKSWRKGINPDYKAQRKKDSDINWDFVYKTYTEFKKRSKLFKVLEAPHCEGDDFISFILNKTNQKGQSNLIVSNDHDIKQLINFSIDPLWINFMTNEMYNQEKLFLPKEYQIFLNSVKKLPNNDIFNLNDNNDFIRLMDKFTSNYRIFEVNNIFSLVSKVISGDPGDNIKSVLQISKNGKIRGIGEKGAIGILEEYKNEFGEISLEDPDLYENIADIICEKKKISKTNIPNIINKIKYNMSLINLKLTNLPNEIVNEMNSIYDKI